MRITEIRDETVSIRSEISNAFISFAEMTVSAVAVITDVIRDGKPVCGFGFNSNGRYGQGIFRERAIPRLLRADAAELLTEDGTNVDPFKAWDIMMRNEKPGCFRTFRRLRRQCSGGKWKGAAARCARYRDRGKSKPDAGL